MKKFLALMLSLILSALPVCAEESAPAKNAFYGVWNLVAAVDGATSQPTVDFGMEMTLTLNEDGTFEAHANNFGQESSASGSWTEADGIISIEELDLELIIAEDGLRWGKESSYFLFSQENVLSSLDLAARQDVTLSDFNGVWVTTSQQMNDGTIEAISNLPIHTFEILDGSITTTVSTGETATTAGEMDLFRLTTPYLPTADESAEVKTIILRLQPDGHMSFELPIENGHYIFFCEKQTD